MKDFDKIYSEYFSDVYKFVLSLCQNPTLAEEITQESFFKALKNINSFKGNSSLCTWLCKIAQNTFYTYAKKHKIQAEYPTKDFFASEDTEKAFIDKETAYSVYKILHRLKDPYKEVFWLRSFGELSFAQIGTLFGKTENWARVTYYRAKIFIKENFE